MAGGARIDYERLTAVIVSYNTRELLLRSVASLRQISHEIEIIVVENGSADGSADAVQQAFPEVGLIRNERNRGFAVACNQGIETSQRDFILLLNSDASVDASALDALYDCMTDPRCAASGCAVVDPQGVAAVSTRYFLTSFNQALELTGLTKFLPIPPLRRTHRPKLNQHGRDCSVDWIEASCLLVRHAALNDVGLFDERFFMYSEDEDLCFRFRERGWSVCFSGTARVVHVGGASSSQNREAMLTEFYQSQSLFMKKHYGPAAARRYFFVMRIVMKLKVGRARLQGDKNRCQVFSDRLNALSKAQVQSFPNSS